MRGIAKQSDSIGQGMTVSSQAANRAVNSGSTRTTGRQGRLGPWMGVEWNATTGDPIRVGVKGKVDADTTLRVALGHQAASIREHPERAPANHFRDLGMRTVDVPDAQLDHGDPGILGQDVGDERSHPRVGTVRTDEQVADLRAVVLEFEPVSPLG
jgi:hypothetical protein